jgi:hypothetical protein
MAVSHSFAGEHVEDGSDEEAAADRNHHEIEHGVTSAGVFQTLEILAQRFAMNAWARRVDADQSTPDSPSHDSQYPRVVPAPTRPLFGLRAGFAPDQVHFPILGFERHPPFVP